MTIVELKPEFVFGNLTKGGQVVCVDFKKGQYIDCTGIIVNQLQRLIVSVDCKFYTLMESE